MIYECAVCGDKFTKPAKGEYYCDWVDCENEEPLTYVGESTPE